METIKISKSNASKRGALGELKACVWLLEQGYDVYRNVSPVGKADLVAINPKTQETVLIDVKYVDMKPYHCKTKNQISYYWPQRKAETPGIKLLFVFADGEVSWSLRPSKILTDKNEDYRSSAS